jgi:hypothetical protein
MLDAKTCSARLQGGQLCAGTATTQSGRCKIHGGLSTGPKSKRGKARSAKNGKLGGRPRKFIEENPLPNFWQSDGKPLANLMAKAIANPWQNDSKTEANSLVTHVADQKKTASFGLAPLESSETKLVKTKVVASANVLLRVRCCDCRNLSAGYACLVTATGQVAPDLGMMRACAWYAPM